MLKAICSCLLCQEKKQFCSQVILESYFQLADSDRCVAESKGGLLHELFHVFGVGVVTIRSFLRIMITINRLIIPSCQPLGLVSNISCQQIISLSITELKNNTFDVQVMHTQKRTDRDR